jgi:hypothetical protein
MTQGEFSGMATQRIGEPEALRSLRGRPMKRN